MLRYADRLRALATTLIDQHRARVIVPANKPSSGYWFGGGNMIQDREGDLWLVGRYRNQGDSRTGIGVGDRGLELAIFCSSDAGKTFDKRLSFSKSQLNVGDSEVLSIEGSAIRQTESGYELYVSTEKTGIGYPGGFESFQKPGTGVWSIDRLVADTIDGLADANVEPSVSCRDPQFLHVKDPFLFQDKLLFCTHPFCWSSSNSAFTSLDGDNKSSFDFFPRGCTWDVAITRGTAVMEVPKIGVMADRESRLLFYDGGECVRDLDQHASAVHRPRGYSCEELGGLAAFEGDDLGSVSRLSVNEPIFVSPFGTGCSRYVDVLTTEEGCYATWQQSQDDRSQPLVMNFVTMREIRSLLS